MDITPREMIAFADAVGADVDFSNVDAREYAIAVGRPIGGKCHMRLEPPSIRAYLCDLLGCPVDTEWETVCAAAERVVGKGASVRVHLDRSELTEDIADLGYYSRLGHGLLCCPMCSPPGLLCSDLTLPPMGMPCEVCGITDPKIGRLVLWIHP